MAQLLLSATLCVALDASDVSLVLLSDVPLASVLVVDGEDVADVALPACMIVFSRPAAL